MNEGGKAIIKIKNLCKTFKGKDAEVKALENINVDINKGEIFGIIGLSGAGKSTVVRCINFLERPTSGEVIFDGKNLSLLTPKELSNVRRSISMIFQQFNLLMQRTALQNVCFPLELCGVSKDDAKKKALDLLKLVGLCDKANSYPSQLSGGQKQRVAIARALATNPKVLLCDEATSALDPTTTRSILSLLKEINKNMGVTIVIITHEMGVIEEVCNRVAIIDNSEIAEMGNVRDVFLNPRSDIAKKLVYPGGQKIEKFKAGKCLRIVFDGTSSHEPIISNMILKCRANINIVFADSKNIDGKAFGQLVIQLPSDSTQAGKIKEYLISKGLIIEEVEEYV